MGERPRLEACFFGDSAGQWQRLARVLEFSARKHCPGWDVNVRRIEPTPRQSPLGIPSHVHNTQKMDAWRDVIAASANGDRVLLIDADTMVLRSLDGLWERDFDIAYTVKLAERFPFNSGVVFVRVTPASRAFVDAWQAENARLLEDPTEHQRWRARFGGVNQAALGAMLTNGIVDRLGLRVLKVPCLEWNCEDSSWARYDPRVTRIVHIKASLRRATFSRGLATNQKVRQLVNIWAALEREATGVAEQRTPAPPPHPRPQPHAPLHSRMGIAYGSGGAYLARRRLRTGG